MSSDYISCLRGDDNKKLLEMPVNRNAEAALPGIQ